MSFWIPTLLNAEDIPSALDRLLDWKRFKNYELLVFDSEKNIYSNQIVPQKISNLQKLWKQAKTNYTNQTIGCREAHEATKSSYIINTKFLSDHIVFLMNATKVVCMHNQFMSNNPCVIGIDGKYFGWPDDTKFNEIMERESNKISLSDVPLLVDLYLNLTTGAYFITESNLSNFIEIIEKNYAEYSNFEKEILNVISSPRSNQIDASYEIVFFTYSHYTTQSPSGLNKWTIRFGKNGLIKKKKVELVFEFDFPDKIKYGDSFSLN